MHTPILSRYLTASTVHPGGRFSVPRPNLQRLLLIRWLMLLGLWIGTVLAKTVFSIQLPMTALLVITLILSAVNVLTQFRLRFDWPLTQLEFAGHILLDVLGITLLFYYLGGANNPFISYYLVPLAIAAATLPWHYASSLTLISLVAYSLLLFFYQPIAMLSPGEHNHGGVEPVAPIGLHPHTLGMWFNFLLSSALICFFVVRMATALKEREILLSLHREDALRNEQVLGVATLAAGIAHELGTPLTTMKVLIAELLATNNNSGELSSDLKQLNEQILRCRQILKKLALQTEAIKPENIAEENIEQYCKRIHEQWRLLRPDVHAEFSVINGSDTIKARIHPTIDQAILNVLNNAADASPECVIVKADWTDRDLHILIEDNGAGISKEVEAQLGQSIISTKSRGLGLGVFLSNATINRFGGNLKYTKRTAGGMCTEIFLPLHLSE